MAGLEKPSKGAEKILLAQIKQEFAAPAEAIEQYIDLVEEFGVKNNLDISSEINQIKAVSYTHLTLPTIYSV